MRIGYLFNGYLTDKKLDENGLEVSTPDGNATYSWSIEWECHKRGWKLIPLGRNLDEHSVCFMGENAFAAFSQQRRLKSYERMLANGWVKAYDRLFPDLDVVLIEWRWPIPGRNTEADKGSLNYSPDLARQTEVLHYYRNKGVPIIVWDLDHKVQKEDEGKWRLDKIIETSVVPRKILFNRYRVEPPIIVDQLLQHKIDDRLPLAYLGYIGSRYERDETIDKWIKPIAPKNTHRIKFWGKWEPLSELQTRWPGVNFNGRIGVCGFREAYSRVAMVPLLAKQSYYECGFVTPRIWEAILFGSIPIGLSEHQGIDQYVQHVATDATDLFEKASYMRNIASFRRELYREEAANKVKHMDVRNFVDVIENLAST